MNSVVKRMKRRTPKFFVMLRNAGLALAAAGAAISASPIVLPAIVVKVAGYLIVAGTVTSAVSQTAVTNDKA